MTAEHNKAMIKHFYEEFFNRGELAAADAIHSTDFLYHDLGQLAHSFNHEDYKRRKEIFLKAFPDQVVHIDEMVAEGDQVVVRSTMFGIQSGPLPGIPETGKEVRVASIAIYRFANGKIVEEWELWDALSMYQQLGIDPFKQSVI